MQLLCRTRVNQDAAWIHSQPHVTSMSTSNNLHDLKYHGNINFLVASEVIEPVDVYHSIVSINLYGEL